MEALQALPSTAFILGCMLFGLLIGSFLNVLIYRLPIMLQREWAIEARAVLDLPEPEGSERAEPFNLMQPASRCPGCGRRIRPWQNVPLLSWLWLRGHCSGCGMRISARYPLVELVSCLLAGVVAWFYGPSPAALAMLVLTWGLLSLSLIDLDHQLLPDDLVLPLLWLGLILNAGGLFVPLEAAVWGAVAGYLSLWSVYWLFRLLTGKEGMGYGDFKLLAMLGAWGGWQILPLTLLLSSLVGAVLGGLLLALRGKSRSTPLPFGPYLATAGWIALLWGDAISNGYIDWVTG